MHSTHVNRAWLILLLGAALLACKGGSKGGVTQAKLGTISGSMPNLKLAKETSRLPLIPSSSGQTANNFGICFHYENPAAIGELSILVKPPSAIKTGSVQLEQEKAGDGVRMKLQPLEGSAGDFCQEMFFEAGDPPGKWHFELQQGATVLGRWDADVYAP
ncbi:MAG: hypothetical protein IPI67_35965 [Myxococcales bacterium]|nr:hypothetical protein [Myxococcales bacterium]